jgi:transcriptional regulator with XRE-family HTH domain
MTIAPEGNRRPAFSMGDRLRKARELTGLEKQVFAEQIGIHRDSLTKYESDRQAPRPPVLMAWALATGVDLEWLKTGAEEQTSGPTGGGGAFSPWSPLSDSNRRPPLYKSGALAN